MMTATDKHDEYMDFDVAARMIVSSDIDYIISWYDYFIRGDFDEIKKIVRADGIINIGVEDIISTLSTTNTNYVTSGSGFGMYRIDMALNRAINRLPVKLQDIQKVIINVWISDCRHILMSEIKEMGKCLECNFPQRDLIWGIAVDPDIKEDIKITLIAVNKHKLC